MPLIIETKLFTHPFSRFLWIIIHPLFYAFRPFIKHPLPLTIWEIINFIIQITFNIIVWYYFGIWTLNYFIIGTILGLGLHPLSGHFISEHYLFADNQATHSYYGIGNYLMYNLGYHVEHHDFPYIAYTNLPKLKLIAKEYYDHLPYHTSLYLSKPEIYQQCLSNNLLKCAKTAITLENEQKNQLIKEKKA
ncbi:Sphingolipid delta(4)-desaturase DES1 [Schistosoma japonicum]|uniref:Sphingolipid delta(4)-desaturase DES1 n=1 Tax=Schistosoma japonicum TaxID=6182 RepID=A0A4Z2DHV7_SCHJA|nr:Sphingolipid delta(4)-desaturase DES1 [Schistosoma japonicum]